MIFIPDLKRLPEVNIQAEIYHQCKLLNIHCILELRLKTYRPDIIIFKNDQIIGIIEVKNHVRDYSNRPESKQAIKYKSLGYPFYLCKNLNDIPQTMKIIQDWINLPEPDHRGISG